MSLEQTYHNHITGPKKTVLSRKDVDRHRIDTAMDHKGTNREHADMTRRFRKTFN